MYVCHHLENLEKHLRRRLRWQVCDPERSEALCCQRQKMCMGVIYIAAVNGYDEFYLIGICSGNWDPYLYRTDDIVVRRRFRRLQAK